NRKLTIRIGYHFGPVIEAGEDVYGDSVNVAARMAGLALAGQGLTTGETGGSLGDCIRGCVRRLDAMAVEGKSAEIEVYEQSWESSSTLTVVAGRERPAAPLAGPRLRLVHRGEELAFKGFVQFGRESAADLVVVAGPMVSRRHARIEQRGGK